VLMLIMYIATYLLVRASQEEKVTTIAKAAASTATTRASHRELFESLDQTRLGPGGGEGGGVGCSGSCDFSFPLQTCCSRRLPLAMPSLASLSSETRHLSTGRAGSRSERYFTASSNSSRETRAVQEVSGPSERSLGPFPIRYEALAVEMSEASLCRAFFACLILSRYLFNFKQHKARLMWTGSAVSRIYE
jgi:hypothetical protein